LDQLPVLQGPAIQHRDIRQLIARHTEILTEVVQQLQPVVEVLIIADQQRKDQLQHIARLKHLRQTIPVQKSSNVLTRGQLKRKIIRVLNRNIDVRNGLHHQAHIIDRRIAELQIRLIPDLHRLKDHHLLIVGQLSDRVQVQRMLPHVAVHRVVLHQVQDQKRRFVQAAQVAQEAQEAVQPDQIVRGAVHRVQVPAALHRVQPADGNFKCLL